MVNQREWHFFSKNLFAPPCRQPLNYLYAISQFVRELGLIVDEKGNQWIRRMQHLVINENDLSIILIQGAKKGSEEFVVWEARRSSPGKSKMACLVSSGSSPPTFLLGIVLANLKVNGIPAIIKIIKAPGNMLSISRETRHVGCILGLGPKNWRFADNIDWTAGRDMWLLSYNACASPSHCVTNGKTQWCVCCLFSLSTKVTQ